LALTAPAASDSAARGRALWSRRLKEQAMIPPRAETDDPAAQTHFGFSDVPLEEKQRLVDGVFHKVADRYDLMNDLMSGGLHRAWKDVLAAMIKPSRHRPFRHLDVAGGTGDVAFRILDAGGPGTHVTALDINADMLRVGADRAAKRAFDGGIDFVEANAEHLPFPDKHFDAYTIAFGIRNVPRIPVALKEAHRVLKTGGRFLCLEFSDCDVPGLDKLYEAFSFSAIPAIGKVVTGDGAPYRYLVESIAKFPDADEFQDMVAAAGFRRASFTRLTGGIVAIHSGWKI
jgi:demethylmenaquinone methyltransferase / 2-methoxy-6-polyprenyl-1,4-benzoquinol methylase